VNNEVEYTLMQFLASQKEALALHRFIRLRRRYLLTRNNKIRLRYVTAASVLAVALAATTLNSYTNMNAMYASADNVGYDVASIEPAAGDSGLSILQSGISSGIRKASDVIQKANKPHFKEVEVGKGDTVAGLLQNAGLSGTESYQAVKALGKYVDVRKIRSGQKIDLHYRPGDDGELELSKMQMKLDPTKEVQLVRAGPDDFRAEIEERELVSRTHAKSVKIETSLYGSAARANIPQSVIAEVIRIYSWNIDFQRDIQPGDKIEVLYDSSETEDGDYSKLGNVLYASLTVGGRQIPIYRYEMEDGRVDYFGPDGTSTRKTLMKTPIDGARISSGFGMRRHPVLGYTKMHKGMDFAASVGTPIYAAGDGKVEYAGRFSSYGNYVRISHNSKLKTAYAHMHHIASGIKPGTRVRQGQVIGYVGTTGRSTGPHLHYEVMVNSKQVNPKSIDLPTGEQLAGKDLKRFKSMMSNVKQQYVTLSSGQKFAQNASHTPDNTRIR
jgi:murein DD-endopeptidase MepM/ murein hydrolase activator NlpD